MTGLEHKNFARPDETREFMGHGHMDVVNLTDYSLNRAIFEPGWRWSNDVQPIAGTERCMARHTGYVVSGAMIVEAADGTEARLTAGDAYLIEPDHDAWVDGDEPVVTLDFSPSMATYAKR